MASTAPTFLTLPREVCDTVYGYLTHTARIDWTPDQDDEFAPSLPPSSVVFENAPLPLVLRMNSQIRDEYMESDCFAHLSASTNATYGASPWAGAYLNPPTTRLCDPRSHEQMSASTTMLTAEQTYRLQCALPHVRHLVVYKNGMMWHHLDRLKKFIHGITAIAPGLLTVKTALQVVNPIDRLWHHEFLQGDVKNLATARSYCIPTLPNYIAGLPLLQRADSYRLKPGFFFSINSIENTLPGRTYESHHMPAVSAVFLYGSDKTHEKYFWDPQQIMNLWPIPVSQEMSDLFEYKSDEEAEMINQLPLLTLG
jgi:hypothetical protein